MNLFLLQKQKQQTNGQENPKSQQSTSISDSVGPRDQFCISQIPQCQDNGRNIHKEVSSRLTIFYTKQSHPY